MQHGECEVKSMNPKAGKRHTSTDSGRWKLIDQRPRINISIKNFEYTSTVSRHTDAAVLAAQQGHTGINFEQTHKCTSVSRPARTYRHQL